MDFKYLCPPVLQSNFDIAKVNVLNQSEKWDTSNSIKIN